MFWRKIKLFRGSHLVIETGEEVTIRKFGVWEETVVDTSKLALSNLQVCFKSVVHE